MAKAPPGWVINPAGAPMMTPPANVAFTTSYMLNLLLTTDDTTNAARQLAVSDIIVFPITIDFSTGEVAKNPALKEGQNIHKNKVPIIAKVLLICAVLTGLIFFPYSVLPIKKLTTNPKYAPNVWIAVLPPASNSLSWLYTIS